MITFFSIFSLWSFLFGLIVGSFLNCLIWRLHTGESMWGRSHCPQCQKQIAWYDNIPVLSYFILGGKCRHCQKKISFQYPLVELLVGVFFVLAFTKNYLNFSELALFDYHFWLWNLRDWYIIAIFTIIFIYDLRWYLVLDRVTLPAIFILFFFNLYLGFSWQNLLISGIIGGSFFLLQFVVSGGKWIGGGDLRIGLLMGVALGWPDGIVAIFISYIIGAMVAIPLLLFKKKEMKSEIPLGTFLAVGTLIVLFWGRGLISWYLNFLI